MNEILNNAVTNYLNKYYDIVTNFPQDGQKQVSRIYEVDCRHSHIINKMTKFATKTKEFTSADEQRIKKMLIESLDLADRKVHISACLLEMVEKNVNSLKMSKKEIEDAELNLIKSNKRTLKSVPENKEIDSNSIDGSNMDNSNKRPKRNVTKISTSLNKSMELNANLNKKSSTNQNNKKTTLNKKSKTQSSKNKKVVSDPKSSDSDGDAGGVDGDLQPTYCLCEEISYGDMVCCDNDLCPMQWFHFGCVSINRSPKGQWFCPFCRGINSKTMKPKAVFLEELEKYNKRKEEN